MKKALVAMVVSAAIAGCGSINPAPSATTGWLFQVGSPSLVHVPVIADQGTGQTQTTHIGTTKMGGTVMPQGSPSVPVLPVPRPANQPAGACSGCQE